MVLQNSLRNGLFWRQPVSNIRHIGTNWYYRSLYDHMDVHEKSNPTYELPLDFGESFSIRSLDGSSVISNSSRGILDGWNCLWQHPPCNISHHVHSIHKQSHQCSLFKLRSILGRLSWVYLQLWYIKVHGESYSYKLVACSLCIWAVSYRATQCATYVLHKGTKSTRWVLRDGCIVRPSRYSFLPGRAFQTEQSDSINCCAAKKAFPGTTNRLLRLESTAKETHASSHSDDHFIWLLLFANDSCKALPFCWSIFNRAREIRESRRTSGIT